MKLFILRVISLQLFIGCGLFARQKPDPESVAVRMVPCDWSKTTAALVTSGIRHKSSHAQTAEPAVPNHLGLRR